MSFSSNYINNSSTNYINRNTINNNNNIKQDELSIIASIHHWNNDTELFEHIRKLFELNQRQNIEIELCIDRLIQLAPNNWTYHLFCVQIFKEWKNYNRAYFHINQGIKLLKTEVRSPKIYNRWLSTFFWFKAHMLFNEKKYIEICECMSISLKHEHKDMDLSYNWRASAYCELKEYKKAINDYTRAIKHSQAPSSYYNSRGTCYHETKQYEKALKDYNEALKLDNQCVSGYNNRASLYVELHNYKLALKDCEDGLSIYPRHGNLYKHKGMALFGIKKYGESIDCLQKAIKLVPNYRPARVSLKIIWNFYFNNISLTLYKSNLFENNQFIDKNLIKLLSDFIVGNNYIVTDNMVDATYSDWKKELNEFKKEKENKKNNGMDIDSSISETTSDSDESKLSNYN